MVRDLLFRNREVRYLKGVNAGPEGNRIAWAVFFLTVAFSVLFSTVRLFDQDTWFHLAVGRFLTIDGFPTTNTFSSLFTDFPWKNPEWLFDLLAYLTYMTSGILGAQALQVLLVTGTFTLVTATVLRHQYSFGRRELLVYLPLLLMALSASRDRFVLRPHLVTYFLFALTIYLARGRRKKLVYWLGAIGFAWSYFHPGVVIGLVLALIFIATAYMEKDPNQLQRTSVGSLVFFLASLANPFFILPYTYAFTHLVMKETTIQPVEFRPPMPGENPTFYFAAALTILLLPVAFKKRDHFHLIGTPFFLILAFSARRFIPLYFIVALPGLVDGALALWGGIKSSSTIRWVQLSIIFTLTILVGNFLVGDWNRYYRHFVFGLGVNQSILPSRACQFIEEHDLSGIMYNDLRFGGYLMWRLWPDRLVFQDGRIIPYPPDFLKEMHGKTTPLTPSVWRGYMNKYDVSYALVRRDFLGQDQEIIAPLFEDIGWPLVYLDGISAVYVRPGSVNHKNTTGLEFSLLSSRLMPLQLYHAGNRVPGTMLQELKRVPPESVLLPHDALSFAAAALGAGDRALAKAFAGRGDTPLALIEKGLLSRDGRK
jgi:hypothetical protein